MAPLSGIMTTFNHHYCNDKYPVQGKLLNILKALFYAISVDAHIPPAKAIEELTWCMYQIFICGIK